MAACHRGVVPGCLSLPMAKVVPAVFFFSRRSLHTRFKCDWSSDVCSSDLHAYLGSRPAVMQVRGPLLRDPVPLLLLRPRRSEEHTSELQSHLNLVCRLL